MIIPNNGKLSQAFFEMQKMLKPDYAIEVGAHGAEFSVAVTKEFGIKAIAFEANVEVFNKYSKSVSSDLLTYLNYAISDKDEEVTLKIHHHPLDGSNSIKQRSNAEIIKEHVVQAYSLDSYFKDYDFSKACLWIDVEGANREVLLGGIETLKRCETIFIETEDIGYWQDQWLTKDVQLFLEDQGFDKVVQEAVYLYQKNIIFRKRRAEL